MTNFYYYNINPQGNIEGDCVTRAISLATGIPYNAVRKLLKITAQENDCDELCIDCYHNLLDGTLGYRVMCPKEMKRVEEIAKEFGNNVLIVRIEGHLTACLYGVCVDIWDCTKEVVDCFWIVS